MKRLLCLLLILLPLTAHALTGPGGDTIPDTPLWQGKIRMETRLRLEKDMESRAWLGKVPEDALLDVYAVDGEWCICGYHGEIGYIPWDRMYQFYRLTQEPLPGATVVEGVATMTRDVFLMVDGYAGNTVNTGDRLCVRKTGLIPMMHGHAQLAWNAYDFEAFITPEESCPGDALYGFTTFYNDSMGGKYPENRAFNIEEAVRRLQNVIIQPGETFSFNRFCGPYTEENGYRLAKNISDDGYGYGGGVCQVSSTMYWAAIRANLEIVKREQHSLKVGYTALGYDATVNYDGRKIDFSFRNNTGSTLYITTKVRWIPSIDSKHYLVVCEIYGPAPEANVTYDIVAVESDIPIPEEIPVVPDEKAEYVTYTDETKTVPGKVGTLVESYKVMYVDGVEVERTPLYTDTYKPVQTVTYVGVTERPLPTTTPWN